MALSGIERLLDTGRGRGVWSGVEARVADAVGGPLTIVQLIA
jgi:hypothetical protein